MCKTGGNAFLFLVHGLQGGNVGIGDLLLLSHGSLSLHGHVDPHVGSQGWMNNNQSLEPSKPGQD